MTGVLLDVLKLSLPQVFKKAFLLFVKYLVYWPKILITLAYHAERSSALQPLVGLYENESAAAIASCVPAFFFLLTS